MSKYCIRFTSRYIYQGNTVLIISISAKYRPNNLYTRAKIYLKELVEKSFLFIANT